MLQTELPVVDNSVCISCGACIDICPERVLQSEAGGGVAVVGTRCMLCGHCHAICPVEAIAIPALNHDLGLLTIDEKVVESQAESISAPALVTLMRRRRSCRLFKPDPVGLSLLTDLVRIGTTAPSGTNSQGWRFIVLPERGDVEELGEAAAAFYLKLNRKAANPFYRFLARLVAGDALGSYYRRYYTTIKHGLAEWNENRIDRLFHHAPAAIIVTAEKSSSCPGEDALLATQNILLAAQSMGLGTCLIGFVVEAARRDKRIGALLRLDDDETIHSVIACGYPAITFQRAAGRKTITPRITRLSRGNRMQDSQAPAESKGQPSKRVRIVLYSFGFKHGVPVDANMVWDVRFLPNPYWQEALRPLSGCEQAVSDFVVKSSQGKTFLELLKPLLAFLLGTENNLEKRNLRLAVGCTGGRHRSVAIVEELRSFLLLHDVDLTVFHRDMEREDVRGDRGG